MNATASQTKINNLFIALEKTRNFAEHCNRQELAGGRDGIPAEAYGKVFSEELTEAANIQKRLIRALFREGQSGIGEAMAKAAQVFAP